MHYLKGITAILALSFAVPAAALLPRPTDSDYLTADEFIFRGNEVTVLEVTMDPADFQFLLDNPHLNDKKVCSIRWKNSVIDEVVADVGIRPRGNLSRNAARLSWKLDFNDFVPGRDFYTLEEMDINGDNNDPTLLRRRLAHELFFRMGLPTARTHYVAIYINGQFRSVNVHVETIDEEFTSSWFDDKAGNLYKCAYKGDKADLAYRPAEDYQTLGGGETYRETNNDPASDYTDLIQFIDFVNNTTAPVRYDGLHSRVNVDSFLRYLASNVATGSWDDYWYGSNNYFLFYNSNHNLFEFLPYDYDNVLGTDFFGVDWAARHFDGWGDGGYGSTPAPLVDAVFDHSEWRRQYRRYLREAAEILEDPDYQALAAQWHALLEPWFDGTIESGGVVGAITSSDQHVPYFADYNLPATYTASGAHRQGLIPYMNQRASSLHAQLDGGPSTDPLPLVRINEVMASNTTTHADSNGEYDDWVELYNDETVDVDLSGWYLTDQPSFPMLYQFPAGTIIPAKGFLLIWTDNQPLQQTPTELHADFALSAAGETVQLLHNDAMGKVLVDSLTFPATAPNLTYGRFPDGSDDVMTFEVPTPSAPNDDSPAGPGGGNPRTPPRVFINEFMASNSSTITDNFGEFEDWVELYNDEDAAVDLTGMFLTDNLANPTKWQFPAGTSIPAKGFLLIWTDNNPAQSEPGVPHASWALSASGEAVGLFDNEENSFQPIHSFSFGAQVADVSMGLLPDGTGAPVQLDTPTPESSNSAAGVADWWY